MCGLALMQRLLAAVVVSEAFGQIELFLDCILRLKLCGYTWPADWRSHLVWPKFFTLVLLFEARLACAGRGEGDSEWFRESAWATHCLRCATHADTCAITICHMSFTSGVLPTGFVFSVAIAFNGRATWRQYM